METRFEDYDRVLAAAKANGYSCETIAATWERIKAGTLTERTFVMRNDVDTDARTASGAVGDRSAPRRPGHLLLPVAHARSGADA